MAAAACCLVGWGAIFIEVETVLFSGPVIFAMGVAVIIISTRLRFPLGWVIGIAHCAICILFFTLVNAMKWGPAESRTPFLSMGAIYVSLVVPATIWAYSRVPVNFDPNHCAGCGYLLHGLTTARCPECGKPFDASLVDAQQP